jgi:hypothetical protein
MFRAEAASPQLCLHSCDPALRVAKWLQWLPSLLCPLSSPGENRVSLSSSSTGLTEHTSCICQRTDKRQARVTGLTSCWG